MRKLRGWIINLADAKGPPDGTVEVHAYLNDDDEPGDRGGNLNLDTHDLGYLNVVHQAGPGGSGSATAANSEGHFGWDMEFNPGPITTRITAKDPEPWQYRARFPDESAQIGKAFHSDLERLGWASGRDCLAWGAIEGVTPPTPAEWGASPLTSSKFGDWSVATEGTGVTAGRVLLRRGVGFLGGVVFSIEHADLVVPIPGEEGGTANGSTTDRWDLLVAVMHNDPGAPTTYGKQRIVIQRGEPNGKVPPLDPVPGQRRMVIHAMKMAAGGTNYSDVLDMRPWVKPPSSFIPGLAPSTTRNYCDGNVTDDFDVSLQASMLNNTMANDEIILPLDSAWTGMATYHCNLTRWVSGLQAFIYCNTEGRSTQGGPKVDDTDYAVPPSVFGYYRVPNTGLGPDATYWNQVSATFPIRRIASGSEGRTWHRLRFAVRIGTGGGGMYAVDQSLAVNMWPTL